MRQRLLFSSRRLPAVRAGTLVEVAPERAGWELIHFAVRQVVSGGAWQDRLHDEECCLVLLSGSCSVTWSGGASVRLGPRPSVFEGYPHAVYLPPRYELTVTSDDVCEIADCRAVVGDHALGRAATVEPRLVRPEECGFEIRGGGNATRQIVDVLPPPFPAVRLMICEVFTPGGNWSSYPPHKHDTENLPVEADLEETYYYRMRDPRGYGFQRLYTADGRVDRTMKVEHGDLVLIREGYHPFVTAYGYDAYYLNVLAGPQRSMAASDDPRYAELRSAWPPADPRVPLVAPPPSRIDPPWMQAATAGLPERLS